MTQRVGACQAYPVSLEANCMGSQGLWKLASTPGCVTVRVFPIL